MPYLSLRSGPGFALLVPCLFAKALVAQDGELTPEGIFDSRIAVEIVNVDVVVTDKKGRSVDDLTREDFELRIDGQEVPIANFYQVTAAEAAVATRAAPGASAGETAASPIPQDPLHIVIYLDSFYLTPASRKQVLKDLPGFLERQVAAGAEVMIVTRAQSAELLTPFTTDLDALRAALAKAEDAPAAGMQKKVARRSTLDSIQGIYESCLDVPGLDPCEDCFDQMSEMIRFYSLAAINERRWAMAALSSVTNALSVLEGRKALLHVSDGIERQTGLDLFYFLGDQLCPGKTRDLQEFLLHHDVQDLDDIVSQANASRVTLYALEASGLRGFSAASVEYGNKVFTPSAENDRLRTANLQGTLFYLSEETGGRSILNANQFAPALDQLTNEMRTYYSLGYQPRHPGRGRSHRVAVKVSKRNLQVRYRRAFLHKKPEQLLADKALGAVLFGAEENPLGVEIRHVRSAGETTRASGQSGGEGRVSVALEVSVPLGEIALIPHEEASVGRLTVVVAAPDEKARKTVVRKHEFDIELAGREPSDARDEIYRFGVHLELASGKHRLGVGVWDEFAAKGSFLGVQVEAAGELPGVELAATDESPPVDDP